ncbi:MAG: hypothetical protein JWP08_2167, partial [Bryobacterales bacterium]|nr:hypothetical protein [Bryobacterales bacterium]
MKTSAGLFRRIFVFVVTVVVAYPADMPVRQVTLYKHGIGFFEREGIAPAGEEMRLDFRNSDMNDVLKSLTVTDLAGGLVNAIRYDSNETPEQRLSKFPFQLGSGEMLSAFLDRLKGARMELKLAEKAATGSIVGARAFQTGPENDKRGIREQVTLLLDSGDMSNYDLQSVSSMRLLDSHLEEQLKQYLSTLGQTRSRDKRSVYVEADGKDARHLRASYISPTAIWKSSYRLTMDEANSTLEGWAIVDNTTDEDWNGVRLAVVSGRPISFVSLLDTPRYGQRQVAELPEDRAAGPVVYGGSVEEMARLEPAAQSGGVARGVIGGVVGGVAGPPPETKQFIQNQLSTPSAGLANMAEVSSVAGATGATLGELFEYNFAKPVTIKKNQSAMLPFLQDKVQARKLLIYTDRDGEHPVNAAELTNKTAKTLDGGPITVYDGGAYAGEALFETLKAGDKRLVGYAVDFGTRITSAFGGSIQSVREIHVKNGTLQIKYAQHQTRNYDMKNVDAKAKTVIVQEDGVQQYTVISPKPIERTATAYRFEVKVPANGSQNLKVEQELTTFTSQALTNYTPDDLLIIVENRQ